jgi:hypothetical protein
MFLLIICYELEARKYLLADIEIIFLVVKLENDHTGGRF